MPPGGAGASVLCLEKFLLLSKLGSWECPLEAPLPKLTGLGVVMRIRTSRDAPGLLLALCFAIPPGSAEGVTLRYLGLTWGQPPTLSQAP